jgi:hypothetical protein
MFDQLDSRGLSIFRLFTIWHFIASPRVLQLS